MKPKPSELLPCPFCGREAYSWMNTGGFWFIECSEKNWEKCNIRPGLNAPAPSKEQAIKIWNTRPESPLVGLDEVLDGLLRHLCDLESAGDIQINSGMTWEGMIKMHRKPNNPAKFGSPQKVHACKCRTGNDCARTVKRLDEDLFECPRCGGIIVPKPDHRFVEVDKAEIAKLIQAKGKEWETFDDPIAPLYYYLAQALASNPSAWMKRKDSDEAKEKV